MKSLVFALPLLVAGCVSTDTAPPSQYYATTPEAANVPVAQVDTFRVMPVPPQVFVAPDPVTGVSTPYVTTNNGVFATDLKATPFKGN